MKYHLKRTIDESNLTFEELATLLSQIEACVNSRPLCQLSSSPNDVDALTPAHFLVDGQLVCPLEQSFDDVKVSWLDRWQRVQIMGQQFWKRWQMDYLNQLQSRSKWQTRNESHFIGDAVLAREENLPPAQWLMGRITTSATVVTPPSQITA